MDQLNPDAHNNPNQTQPKIGHGGERPDFELGKLDPREEARLLSEFHSREAVPDALVGRTQIEDAADTLARTNGPIITDTLPTTEIAEKPEKKKAGLGKKIGGAVAGLLIAGGAVFGVTQLNNGNGNNTPPEKNPDDTTQVEPGTDGEEKPPVETEKTFEQLVDETKIEAGLSAEEYAETLQSRLNDWALAGVSDEAFQGWVDAEGSDTYLDELAASQTAIYTNALFGPGYQNEQSLVNAEANLTSRNAAWLSSWMRSYDFNNDKGTFELSSVIEQAEVISENPETGERVLYIAGYETNNAEDAMFTNESNRQNALSQNGAAWDDTLTLKTIDGVEYIVKWED